MQARQSDRVTTTATGSCKTARGAQWDIQLDNLSCGGCRVDDPRSGLELGTFVELFIAETGPYHAEVAWRQSARVGLEFVKPLPERVFKLLAKEEWDAARVADSTGASHKGVRRVC